MMGNIFAQPQNHVSCISTNKWYRRFSTVDLKVIYYPTCSALRENFVPPFVTLLWIEGSYF